MSFDRQGVCLACHGEGWFGGPFGYCCDACDGVGSNIWDEGEDEMDTVIHTTTKITKIDTKKFSASIDRGRLNKDGDWEVTVTDNITGDLSYFSIAELDVFSEFAKIVADALRKEEDNG